MGLILVTGVPGVGKTTVLAHLQTKRPIVNLGTAILEAAAGSHPGVTRDGLRSLPSHERARLREDAVRDLEDDTILDTHLSIRASSGLEPSLPAIISERGIRAIVLLEARAHLILARRASRSGRADPQDTIESILEQQAFNRAEANRLASSTGAEIVLLESDDARAAATAIQRLLDASS